MSCAKSIKPKSGVVKVGGDENPRAPMAISSKLYRVSAILLDVMDAARLMRDARKAAGLTQAELARRIGRPQSVIARLEAPGANPKLETLNRAVAATGHSIQAILAPGMGIDETMIAADLRISPNQRLRNFESFYDFARRSGGTALKSGGS
jgi:transcriptional regulator with XRE-family HTH domain